MKACGKRKSRLISLNTRKLIQRKQIKIQANLIMQPATEISGLKLNWYKEVDFATAFGIYKLYDDFIIHGKNYIIYAMNCSTVSKRIYLQQIINNFIKYFYYLNKSLTVNLIRFL